jgi:phage antirepressor YoqD-like protein
MNGIINSTADAALTMSSREIAELCEKRHDHVMRDIKKMLDDLGENAPRFGGVYSGGNGEERPCFDLPKDLTLTLVAGYNVKLRKRIIDRWLELEARLSKPVSLSGPQLMAAALIEADVTIKEQAQQIQKMSEDVIAYERIAVADGSLCVTDAAKTLQVRPKDLFTFLRTQKWIYRRPGGAEDLAYQSKLITDLLEHKTTTVHRSDGSERVTTQVRVTPKGLARLSKELPSVGRLL